MSRKVYRGIFGFLLFIGGLYMVLKSNHYLESKDSQVEYVRINDVDVSLIFEQSDLLPVGEIRLVFQGAGSMYDAINAKDVIANPKNTKEAKAGLANLASGLLNEGTYTLGNIAFADKLESKAITLNVGSGMQTLSFELSFLKEQQDFALSCLVDLLKDPNITQESLAKLKDITKATILRKENDFDYVAHTNLDAIFFENTPMEYPSMGDIASVDSITLEDIQQYLRQNLVLNRLIIVAGGDMQQQELKDQLTKELSFLPVGTKVAKPSITPRKTPKEIVVTKQTQQAYIHFASPFYAKTTENYKTKVMSFVLGSSGFGSRIMEEVRVKRGLAYSAYFSITGGSDVVNYGVGYLQTGLDSKDEALKVVQEVMQEFVSNGITQDELDSAKAFILGSEPLGEETLSQRLQAKFMNYMRNMPLDSHKQDIAKISHLSLKEMNDFIAKHPEILQLSVSIVQDK